MTSAALARTHAVSPEFTSSSRAPSLQRGASISPVSRDRAPGFVRVNCAASCVTSAFPASLATVFAMVPASSITDPGWLDARLLATGRWYRLDHLPAVGVLWWY